TARHPHGCRLRIHQHVERRGHEARFERSLPPGLAVELHRARRALEDLDAHLPAPPEPQPARAVGGPPQQLRERSEERRVGKECRWRWSPPQYKKKIKRRRQRNSKRKTEAEMRQ